MTLFLVGYMGSGKSLIGRQLADILDYNYIDFDDYIESKEDASIHSIFKTKGEIYFRKAESRYLKDVTTLNETVVSLGGGTPCYGTNMQTILEAKQAQCIYLKATIPTLSQRLFHERSKRPLISHIGSKDELNEFIGKHLFERAPFYEQSHIALKTDEKTVKAIVESILLALF